MANILSSVYQADNFKPNSLTYEITINLDADIDTSEINNYLPNNGSKFKEVSGIGYLATGSSATLYSPSYMYVCSFLAKQLNAVINPITGYEDGVWKCLAKVAFK